MSEIHPSWPADLNAIRASRLVPPRFNEAAGRWRLGGVDVENRPESRFYCCRLRCWISRLANKGLIKTQNGFEPTLAYPGVHHILLAHQKCFALSSYGKAGWEQRCVCVCVVVCSHLSGCAPRLHARVPTCARCDGTRAWRRGAIFAIPDHAGPCVCVLWCVHTKSIANICAGEGAWLISVETVIISDVCCVAGSLSPLKFYNAWSTLTHTHTIKLKNVYIAHTRVATNTPASPRV